MLEIKGRPRRPLVIPSICFVVGLLIGDRISGVYLFKEYPIIGLIPIVGFFVFRSLGKHDLYRRIYAALLIIGFYIMLINTWVMDWSVPDRNNLPKTFIGTVARVEEIDGRTEVLIQGEYRVLINEYEVEGENPRGVTIDDLGKTVSVELKPEKPLDSGNPGCFNYRKYLYGRGIQLTASINVGEIEILEEGRNPYYVFTSFVITKREEYLDSMFKEDEARSIAAGILFGRSREIPEERRNEFMEGGAGHILAVSGIHIGLLYSVYKSIERRLKIKSLILKEGILISFFVIYGTAAMWSVSVTRAMMLVFLKELANLGDRRFDSTSSLILVSDLMLLLRPYLIFSSGFQMSFLAVLGICFFRPKMLYLLNRISKKEVAMTSRDETLSMLASMMSVQVLMIPYTIFVFNRFSVLSIINNWLIVIIAGFYVPFGGLGFFLSSIVGLIPGGGSRLLGAAIGRVLGYMGDSMIWINKTMLLDGNSVWNVVSPDPVLLITILCLGTYLSSETNKIAFARDRIKAIYKVLKIIIFTVILSSFLFFNPVCLSSQVFLDVGQGDSFHIKWGETNILIDGGGSFNYNVAERALKPYLLRRGISSLDAAISTHEHVDHFLGITQLEEIYDINRVITSGRAGDRIVFDENRYIEILWPIPGFEESEDENYFSRIFKVHDRGVTTLITGDITEEGEKALVDYYGEELRSDILKIAHHGSRFSTCQEFIDMVSPKIAVISVGKNNYGHPAPSVIEKLERSGIIVYRTDKDGAVGIIVKEGRFFVCGNRRNMRIEKYSAT